MPTAVLTGCNSGIGHAWAKIMLDEGWEIYALDVNAGDKLKSLEGPKCHVAQVDVTSVESIQSFKKKLGDKPVNILLSIAGIMVPKEKDVLMEITLPLLEKSFSINTFGPLLLTQALLSNVLAAPEPRHIAVMSSRVGSIADNSSGGILSYRASKTAVNSCFKTISLELKEKNVVVSMLHPGFVHTNLDPDVLQMPDVVEPNEAAEKLWKLLQTKTIADTGRFWHREGMELPW